MQKNFFFIVLAFVLLVTCSSFKNDTKMGTETEAKKSPKPAPKVTSIEAKQIASEAESNFVTEISFPKGVKVVPVEGKKEIEKLFKRANAKGQIEEAKIITWADEEYPTKKRENLSPSSLKLVEDRNDNLEIYLEKLDRNMNVSKISMAERPGVMESILSDDDVRLKKSLESYGIPTSGDKKKSDSKASKSIIIFLPAES